MNGIESAVNLLTPTVLFCILNLMIATIFVLNSHKKQVPLAGGELPHQFGRIPSLFGRVRSINISMYRTDQQPDPVHHISPPEGPANKDHDTQPEEPVEEHHEEGDEEHEIIRVKRTKSDTKEKKMKPAARILRKTVSEKFPMEGVVEVDDRRPATVREKKTAVDGEDEEVDSKADDFINKFRQQLKLQRLDSILRYKEMLTRGAAR